MSERESGPCILVIDDDPDIVTYLETFFRDNGYRVLAAGGGEEGLALAREHHPDVICLDISMPAPSGIRVYRDLRDDPALASIPVIMVTGVPRQFEGFIKTRRQVPPPEGYIAKPFEVEKLREVVDDVLRRARA
jgi:CheY-like chemotaxis protein